MLCSQPPQDFRAKYLSMRRRLLCMVTVRPFGHSIPVFTNKSRGRSRATHTVAICRLLYVAMVVWISGSGLNQLALISWSFDFLEWDLLPSAVPSFSARIALPCDTSSSSHDCRACLHKGIESAVTLLTPLLLSSRVVTLQVEISFRRV